MVRANVRSTRQSFDGRSARRTTRSLAHIVRWFILGEIPILSALCSCCQRASPGVFHVILLGRSRPQSLHRMLVTHG